MVIRQQLGRGERATEDMKLRIAALRDQDADVIDVLWRRHLKSMTDGYRYEYGDSKPPEGS